jgi:hypothetical protein
MRPPGVRAVATNVASARASVRDAVTSSSASLRSSPSRFNNGSGVKSVGFIGHLDGQELLDP